MSFILNCHKRELKRLKRMVIKLSETGDITKHDANKIIDCLNREVPYRPSNSKILSEYVQHLCPVCNVPVTPSIKYCGFCGQRLKWGR